MAGRLSFSIAINLLTDQFKRGVNQVKSLFDKIKSQVLGFAAVLGIGGIGLKNYISTAAEFEASISKLSAVLGTTPEKISDLTDNAKKLGETTKYTAAEASHLQIELAKLGFTRNEILQATESVLKLAQATGVELAEAAALAGASLRMFGAEASESKRYASAMSIATTNSALSFNYLAASLPIVGPVAKAFNFQIEDTLALLGKLADSGFDASSAATATRNILLNLADSGGALAKTLGGPVKTLPQLVSGLQKLRDKGVDLNATLQLTDKRSVAAFNAFLESANKITSLREAITGVEGDLDRMAVTMGDNVKGAMAGLSSAWESLMIKFSETTNSPLKNLIKGITSVLRDIKSGFSGLVAFVTTLVVGKLLQSIIGYFGKYWNFINTTVNKAKVAEEQKLLAAKNRAEAEISYMKTVNDYQKFSNGVRKVSEADVRKAEKALNAASLAEKKAIDAAKVASERATALQTTSVWGKTVKTIKLAFAGIATTLKGLWVAAWPMALITGVGLVIGKLVNMRKEANRIKNIFSEYKKEVDSLGNTEEVIILGQQLKIMNDKAQSQKNINNAQAKLQRMLGVEKKSQEELVGLVAKRVKLLKETARADFHARKIVESEEALKSIGDRTYNGKPIREMAPAWAGARGDRKKEDAFKQKYGITSGIDDVKFVFSGFKHDLNSFIELSKVLKHSKTELEKSTLTVNQEVITGRGKGVTVPDKEKTPLQKQQESYNKQFGELGAELEIGKISQAEYNKALGELNIKMYAQAKGTNDKEVLESEYFQIRKAAAEKAIKEQDKNAALVEFEKVQKGYNDKVKEVQAEYSKNLISEKELNTNIASFSIEAAKSAAGIKGIGDEADVFIATMQMNAKLLTAPVKIKPRDTTFDYKKSKVDIVSENLEKAKELAEKYKEEARSMGQLLEDEVADAMAHVPTLEKALELAQVREDIKNLNKELEETLYSGVKDIASGADRIVSAFANLKDVMNDVDSSEWEKILAIWNAMVNLVDETMSIIKTVEHIAAISEKLSGAKKSQESLEKATAETAATSVAQTAAMEVATQMEMQASQKKTEAATTEMAAKSTAAYAGIPFVGLGLASAQIAAMTALIESASTMVPKYATGGIYMGGTTSGDKGLARLNKGEMILNMTQQSHLFEAINAGNLGGDNHITIGFDKFRVDGKYLEFAINNSRKKQGKKPL